MFLEPNSQAFLKLIVRARAVPGRSEAVLYVDDDQGHNEEALGITVHTVVEK